MNKLSTRPADGQIMTLSNGRYRYYSVLNQWVDIGGVDNPEIVGVDRDGIVGPELYDFIRGIGVTNNFKLANNTGCYYYLFNTNNYLRPSIEANNLRLELDRAAITMGLRVASCPGPRGLSGQMGIPGRDGSPGPSEAILNPLIDGRVLSISAPLITPLETEVSLRLTNGVSNLEIWYTIGTREWGIVRSDITLDPGSIITLENGLFSAKLIGEWDGNWSVRVRQRGPSGNPGADGNGFLVVNSTPVYGLKSTQSIASIGQMSGRDLFYTRHDITGMGVVSIRAYTDGGNSGPPYLLPLATETNFDKFAAVEFAPNNKAIRRWVFAADTVFSDVLVLPEWTPNPACHSATYTEETSDWQDTGGRTDPTTWTDATVHRPDFSWGEDLDLPVKIFPQAPTRQSCCQENFFFCPANIYPSCPTPPPPDGSSSSSTVDCTVDTTWCGNNCQSYYWVRVSGGTLADGTWQLNWEDQNTCKWALRMISRPICRGFDLVIACIDGVWKFTARGCDEAQPQYGTECTIEAVAPGGFGDHTCPPPGKWNVTTSGCLGTPVVTVYLKQPV